MKLQLPTLATDIFKLSTSKSFSQKDVTRVPQVQIYSDAGAKPILTLLSNFWPISLMCINRHINRSILQKAGEVVAYNRPSRFLLC